MHQFAKHKVYVKVPSQQCYDSTGKAPIKVRWIDLNKGDTANLRSGIVAKVKESRASLCQCVSSESITRRCKSVWVEPATPHYMGY